MDFNSLLKLVSSNQLFAGGFAVILVGFVIARGRAFVFFIKNKIFNFFTTTIELTSDDDCFTWLRAWSGTLKYLDKRCRKFSVRVEWDNMIPHLIAGNGIHMFIYQKRLMFYSVEQVDMSKSIGSVDKYKVSLSVLSRNKNILKEILVQGRDILYPANSKNIKIQALIGTNWHTIDNKLKRPINSVILPNAISREVLDDLIKFKNSEEEYRKKGIPYHRGYLLHGPPGCGKSSLVAALASELDATLYFVNMSVPTLGDATLLACLLDIAPNSIVLMEDVDHIFKNKISDDSKDMLTFSGLTNILDGIVAPERRIIFMTTNNLDKIDPIMIRPGRVDKIILIDYPKKPEIKLAFNNFYNDKNASERFIDSLDHQLVSMATFQTHFMKYENNPDGAIENIKELYER